MSNRLEILEKSLEKKRERINIALSNHFEDVKSANGQPLNDKSNGQSTFNRWERQNNAIRNLMKEEEKTLNAIEKEKFKIDRKEEAKKLFPNIILEKIELGELKQWGRFPNFLFIDGVEKARIEITKEGKGLNYRYFKDIPNLEQKEKFKKIYNEIYNEMVKNENTKH